MRLSDKSSKTGKKCIFFVFRPFFSLGQTASQPYGSEFWSSQMWQQFVTHAKDFEGECMYFTRSNYVLVNHVIVNWFSHDFTFLPKTKLPYKQKLMTLFLLLDAFDHSLFLNIPKVKFLTLTVKLCKNVLCCK